ncbi:hypothetical protein BJ170DRAFT_687055 [Xylariales sp. AK1849]|nr:hypothetical protein BJ170DRAFT_687055 [Xylariales sp. AK1849]
MLSLAVVSLLAILLSSIASAQDGGSKTQSYTDSSTGIDFLGFFDGTGFQFGMALPQAPSTDLMVQLVSPLTDGGGWGGIDFGESMVGRLMIAAWPNGNQVLISPRIATGYEVDNGANLYSQQNVTVDPISEGTFVNTTHVSATFICGGCINSDSFVATDANAVFAYAYASTPVADPSSVDSQLSDHTLKGEPYGSFSVTIKEAESAKYVEWAKMSESASSSGGSGNNTGSGGSADTNTGNSSSLPGSAPTTNSTGSSADTGEQSASFGSGFHWLMTLVFLLYVAQPFIS